MIHKNLKCSVLFPEKGIARLVPTGIINLQTIPQSPLFSAAQQAVSGPTCAVLFDFNEARVSDGFGLAHIVELAGKLKKKELVVAACNLGPDSTELLRELGFEQLFRFYPNLERALAELNSLDSANRQDAQLQNNESAAHEFMPANLWPPKLGPTDLKNESGGSQPLNLIGRKAQGPGAAPASARCGRKPIKSDWFHKSFQPLKWLRN